MSNEKRINQYGIALRYSVLLLHRYVTIPRRAHGSFIDSFLNKNKSYRKRSYAETKLILLSLIVTRNLLNWKAYTSVTKEPIVIAYDNIIIYSDCRIGPAAGLSFRTASWHSAEESRFLSRGGGIKPYSSSLQVGAGRTRDD